MLYSRRQLALVLALIAAAGAGLAINRWRATHPTDVERLERLDREPELAAAPSARSPAAARPASPRLNPDDRPARRERRARESPPAGPVDVNHATADDLRGLPGVGPKLATRIVESREAGGPFESVDDLRRVPGLGTAKLERLRPAVTVAP